MIPERRRLTYALLLSLIAHALLLRLTFGGNGLWLPGLSFPWPNRWVQFLDVRVVVEPVQITAAGPEVAPATPPPQQAAVGPVAQEMPQTLPVSRPPMPRRSVASTPKAAPRPKANSRTEGATSAAAPAQIPSGGEPGDAASPQAPAPDVIAVPPTDEATWPVPSTAATPAPTIAEAPTSPSPETATPSPRDAGDATQSRVDEEAPRRAAEPAETDSSRQDEKHEAEQRELARQEAARQEAVRQEAARAENARLEAERQEAARAEAAHAEAARVEAARVESERVEAARAEAARVEAERAEAARAEAARVEAARVEAARVEAARVEAARVEAEHAEAARAEAARVEAGSSEAARAAAEQEAVARREAARRAMGRQLDEEAARRDAARAATDRSSSTPPPWSSARRYRLFGRSDPNAELIEYAEGWARKIQLNMTFDMVREAAKQPHTDPLVWVAIRSDGSVESVHFDLSSGVAALDEAIRRVVQSLTPYQAFPPRLAREYDVIEIRRTWHFDVAIRLF